MDAYTPDSRWPQSGAWLCHVFWATLSAGLSCSGPVTIGLGPQPQGAAGDSAVDENRAGSLAGAADVSMCQASVELKRVPLDLVMMLDKSLTMNEVTSTTGEKKWVAVSDAVKQFCLDPASAGIGIAVGFFAVIDASNQVSCKASDYADLPVKMDTLNSQATAVAAAFDGVEFATSASAAKTPMHVALQGAISYARAWASQHLDHDVRVALVTDGAPNACDGTFDDVIAAASEGATNTPSIATHVIAISDPNAIDTRSTTLEHQLANLNQVAATGRTGSALNVDTTKTVLMQDQLASAMVAIRQSYETSCRFALPATSGDRLDIAQVIVRVNATAIPWRRTEAACGTADGYFYDDNTTPSSLSLCTSTCSRVAAQKDSLPVCSTGCSDVPADLRAVSATPDAGIP